MPIHKRCSVLVFVLAGCLCAQTPKSSQTQRVDKQEQPKTDASGSKDTTALPRPGTVQQRPIEQPAPHCPQCQTNTYTPSSIHSGNRRTGGNEEDMGDSKQISGVPEAGQPRAASFGIPSSVSVPSETPIMVSQTALASSANASAHAASNITFVGTRGTQTYPSAAMASATRWACASSPTASRRTSRPVTPLLLS